ncbi:MAG: small subunit ribosomal protein S8 [Parasphingorhabdus sp.]|jgi:small subunit ribosomal protein S8
MSMSDPIADMLTRIRNGLHATKREVIMPASKVKEAILAVLKDEGYIKGYSVADIDGNKKSLNVSLKYYQGRPVIEDIDRISKPGRRVYKSASEIPLVQGGLGVAIMSTSKGIMTGKAAKNAGAGGEVVCTVF